MKLFKVRVVCKGFLNVGERSYFAYVTDNLNDARARAKELEKVEYIKCTIITQKEV